MPRMDNLSLAQNSQLNESALSVKHFHDCGLPGASKLIGGRPSLRRQERDNTYIHSYEIRDRHIGRG